MRGKNGFTGLQRAICLHCRQWSSRRRTTSYALKSYKPQSRLLSTSARRRADAESVPSDDAIDDAIEAAPAINFEDEYFNVKIQKLRVVPASPSYFNGMPATTDTLLRLKALVRKNEMLPVLANADVPSISWKPIKGFRAILKEPIKDKRYGEMISVLRRLHRIHPQIMPEAVKEAILEFRREVGVVQNTDQVAVLDDLGRAKGVGRRKESSAVAFLVEGEGNVLINGKPLNRIFQRVHDRDSAIWALKVTQRTDKYNLWALVKGGGTTGQADALTLAVAKALIVHEPGLKPTLRKAGCITRDMRRVERKKPGHLKSRKMPAWVKR